MTDNESPVLASVRNRVGHLTLNRPAGLNALTLQMVRIMWHQLQAWESEPEVLAVVLRASGERLSAPEVTSAHCTTATRPATTNTTSFLRKNTPSTSTSTATPSPLSR